MCFGVIYNDIILSILTSYEHICSLDAVKGTFGPKMGIFTKFQIQLEIFIIITLIMIIGVGHFENHYISMSNGYFENVLLGKKNGLKSAFFFTFVAQ